MEWFFLDSIKHESLFVPPGCAHGFVTLEPQTKLQYLMGEEYIADLSRGVRWNDPFFDIEWPIIPNVISERDKQFEDFKAS